MSPASGQSRTLLTDPGRLEAVRRYRQAGAASGAALDLIAEIAATVCGTPMAAVSMIGADRVWFLAARGLPGLRQIPTEPGLCASALVAEGIHLVTVAADDPRTKNHPLVRLEQGVRFYAGAPIIDPDGHRLGFVAALDTGPRQLTETQTGVLTQLAALVVEHLRVRLDAAPGATPAGSIPRQPAVVRPG
ncbi:GAF domain-containing protein [Paractinoplanes globisporus]|uniref:GAF domain-containing protein n=1 Tax=Paractinoplanes globisporus TaxID=113565 RepID=A0ABW6W8Y8_9ACTN|nr:GAF domain-containing protein [Actinoplanes globisporus]